MHSTYAVQDLRDKKHGLCADPSDGLANHERATLMHPRACPTVAATLRLALPSRPMLNSYRNVGHFLIARSARHDQWGPCAFSLRSHWRTVIAHLSRIRIPVVDEPCTGATVRYLIDDVQRNLLQLRRSIISVSMMVFGPRSVQDVESMIAAECMQRQSECMFRSSVSRAVLARRPGARPRTPEAHGSAESRLCVILLVSAHRR